MEKLWQHTSAAAPLGEIVFDMPARHCVKARKVRQQLWARKVELPAGQGKTVSATCLIAREIYAPDRAKPIEWRSLNNCDADTLAQAQEMIDWYWARWEIEILFNVLKNVCKVEELQLGCIARIERALALFMMVAWCIAYLERTGRTCPDFDATLYFDQDEIEAAYLLREKPAPPKATVDQVLSQIVCFGGFLARKRHWDPYAEIIWLGLKG